MSHWSIAEHTDHRLVAQTIPRRKNTPWVIRILPVAVIISAYCPGIAALISGSEVLPATAVCIISKTTANTMDCQVSRNLWGRVIRRQTEQLGEAPAPRLELQSPGDTSLFYFGLWWLAGVTGTITTIQILRTRKTRWIFDRTADNIQKQSISLIRKKSQTFDRSATQSIRLEVSDIDLRLSPTALSVRLNIQGAEPVAPYLPREQTQPTVFVCSHPELPEILKSIIQPIRAVTNLPWQLAFWHQAENETEYYIFDFVARSITQYCQGEQVLRLDFAEISGFEVEEPATFKNPEFAIQPERPAVRYLNLIVGNGIRLQIHRYTGFADVATAEIWFHQLEAALQPYFPEMVTESKAEPDVLELVNLVG
jgi:hypothetical protein